MKKKITFTLCLFFAFIFLLLLIYPERNQKTNNDTNISTNSLIDSKKLPSEKERKKLYGNELSILGEYQIVTVFFADKNIAILENNSKNTIELNLTVASKDKLSFNLKKVKPDKDFKIGDKLYLAKKGNQYYLYAP